jgi:hypothetical protein
MLAGCFLATPALSCLQVDVVRGDVVNDDVATRSRIAGRRVHRDKLRCQRPRFPDCLEAALRPSR